ncbi:MAG: hypothetical protein PHI93_00930 [Kiritimatiellae bacterium]|jgi:hypothetical protein|nr:hypothetical protein [Kiritimatiellia bacterium]
MKKALLNIISFVVGIAVGYYYAYSHAITNIGPALDIVGHSYIAYIMETSEAAYRTESPIIAIWALKQSADALKEQLEKDYISPVFTKEYLTINLMINYARLAKLTEDQDTELSNEYINRAVHLVPKRYSEQPMSKGELFDLINKLDDYKGKGSGKGAVL